MGKLFFDKLKLICSSSGFVDRVITFLTYIRDERLSSVIPHHCHTLSTVVTIKCRQPPLVLSTIDKLLALRRHHVIRHLGRRPRRRAVDVAPYRLIRVRSSGHLGHAFLHDARRRYASTWSNYSRPQRSGSVHGKFIFLLTYPLAF